jgi:hypothetical protein
MYSHLYNVRYREQTYQLEQYYGTLDKTKKNSYNDQLYLPVFGISGTGTIMPVPVPLIESFSTAVFIITIAALKG